ncbi:MAG: amino acid aminotransferase, partial [Pirellulales bacterium]
LGLTEAFLNDPRPDKINLGVGVYQDEEGRTPVLASVCEAEARRLREETTKSYLGITGSPQYAAAVQHLLLGEEHEIVTARRAVTSHTPGGTGALRVAADFLAKLFPGVRVWLSRPTWPNHGAVFAAAGVETAEYAYFDPENNRLDFQGLMRDLEKIPPGDVVLLHGCCHNPTGIDPAGDEWRQIAEVLAKGQLVPLIDFAYQGLARGLDDDAEGLRAFARPGAEWIICSSFSKNFGLYRERVGALTVVARDVEAAERVQSQIKRCIRANYSNPPAHGGAIVTTVLSDTGLRRQWLSEVEAMRNRIHAMREGLVETLAAKGVTQDFSFIARQCGMFSFTGLDPEQVDHLRTEHSIYIVRSGRINVAGINRGNLDRLCTAIASVL